mgnify:FL=1|jgi:hypothetical protein
MQAKADKISVIMQSTTELYSEFSEYCMNLIRKVYGDRPVVFPIDIEAIASHIGFEVHYLDFENQESCTTTGILSRLIEEKQGKMAIVVNKLLDAKTQRYAIARGIAKYLLRGEESMFEGIYDTTMIPQDIDTTTEDVIACFLLLPLDLTTSELKEYLGRTSSKEVDSNTWIRQFSDKSMVPVYNAAVGYQHIRQILGYERQKEFESKGFDINKMENCDEIIYA